MAHSLDAIHHGKGGTVARTALAVPQLEAAGDVINGEETERDGHGGLSLLPPFLFLQLGVSVHRMTPPAAGVGLPSSGRPNRNSQHACSKVCVLCDSKSSEVKMKVSHHPGWGAGPIFNFCPGYTRQQGNCQSSKLPLAFHQETGRAKNML